MLGLRYVVLPNLDSYRPRMVAALEQATGMEVGVAAMHADWDGLRPRITLREFRLDDRNGRAALTFDRAEVTLSWWALARGEVRFRDLDLYRPDLTLRRGADGLVYLADKALNAASAEDDGTLTRWLLAQPRLDIHEAGLTWQDERSGGEVRLEAVEITVVRRHGRHHAALTAAPRGGLARAVDLRVDAQVRREGARWSAAGDFFGEIRQADLARLRSQLPIPDTLKNGAGSLRVWARFDAESLGEVVADASLRDVHAQLADDAATLVLPTLAGRVTYRSQPGGFSVATHGLRFRLGHGSESTPGNLRISRGSAPNGLMRTELAADAIDLTLAAGLLGYLPVPRDLKAQVARFAPSGRLAGARVTWTGDEAAPARAYTLDGRFESVTVATVDGFPGVSGLTGEISGTEQGGTVKIASRDMALEMGRIFRAPLRFRQLDARARWQHGDRPLEVTVEEARFDNPDAEGRLEGTWRALPGTGRPTPGFVDFKGTLTRAAATAVADYLPNGVADTRAWLQSAIEAGSSPRVGFEIQGDLHDFPFGPPYPGRFVVEGELRDGRLRYHPEWPRVDGVQGTFRFENRRMEIRAERASIFESAGRVSATIADLAADPPLLVIEGEMATSGADSMRFLRESPLVSGPGAFTRAVAVEGPGRLALRLDYPLWGTQAVKVAGEYTFDGATASVGPRLAMREVRGRLAFSERGVAAPAVSGTLFERPATLAMSTAADGTVVTSLEGRIPAAALAGHVPAAFMRRLSGEASWSARVATGPSGASVTLASSLRGLASTLPAPFGKRADDARPMEVAITRLGAEDELVTATLAGGIHGRFGRLRGAPQRWHAALRFGAALAGEPVREGLWLYGSLPYADVDAWQEVFAEPKAAAAPAATPSAAAGEEFGLRGLDLALDQVHYFGRDFAHMQARLERRGAQWGGSLESPRVAGVVEWNPQGRGRLMARLQRLAIDPSTAPAAGAAASGAPRDELPEIDVAAERFEFRGAWLGRLAFEARPDGADWRISKLDITNDHARFTSKGEWRRAGDGTLTSLELALDSDNLNALLGQFGYGEYVRRGSGKLVGRLVWPGYPYDFATGILSGTFRLDATRGQFSKIEPGAGKLLALLSLQSLPRRASLDFRDVFSEGFAFERMGGEVKLARGVLLVDDFEISGPSAFVSLEGEVSLPAETQALTVRVVPEVGESIALAATLVGTPVLGLSTLLVSKLLKNPFGKVVAYEYEVTGSWDNPQVTRTSAPSRAAAAAAAESPARAATP